MTKSWGLAAAVLLIVEVIPVRAQYMQSEPLPEPAGLMGSPSLPADIANAATVPPPPEDPKRLYVNFEYLLYSARAVNLQNTFITTATNPDLGTNFGALPQSSTTLLAGGQGMSQGTVNGTRLTVGLNPDDFLPLEISGFWMQGGQHSLFQSSSNGSPLLARDVFSLDPTLLVDAVFLAGFPRLISGAISLESSTTFYGGEVNFLTLNVLGDVDRSGLIGLLTCGARYMGLNENLAISNSATAIHPLANVNFNGGVFGQGFNTGVQDHFDTRNQFAGGQIGLRASYPIGRLNLDFRSNLAVGMTHQKLHVFGISSLSPPSTLQAPVSPAAQIVSGGIQAVASNSGEFSRDSLSIVPDMTISLELPILDSLILSVGYNFVYWSNVARPGDQVPRYVDTRQAPTDAGFDAAAGATQPAPSFYQTGFWAQGLSLSLAFAF